MPSQLAMGRKIELEHKDVIPKIKSYVKKHGKIPNAKQLAEWVAMGHIKEDPRYYTKLKKAKL